MPASVSRAASPVASDSSVVERRVAARDEHVDMRRVGHRQRLRARARRAIQSSASGLVEVQRGVVTAARDLHQLAGGELLA